MRLHRNLSILAIVLLAGFGALARSDEGKDEEGSPQPTQGQD